MTADPQSLAESFLRYFDVCRADDVETLRKVGKIRYRVYCEEFDYEPRDRFPGEHEHDEFDDDSLHCLITHRGTQAPAGCVRVVLGKDGAELPFERFCMDSLDAEFFEQRALPRSSFCEISRLAVDGKFRRRSGEYLTRFGGADLTDLSASEQRTFPLIAVACYLASIAVGSSTGRTYAFAMMEPFLPKLLKRSGIPVTKIGDQIDYHGLRAPYFMTLDETLSSMSEPLQAFYNAIVDRVGGVRAREKADLAEVC